MIKSLQEINSSLVSLSHQLSNKEVIDQQLKRHITNLLSEVRYLDEKQKSQYYFFISEIYAFKFHNISDAETELKQFDNSLDMEISMNCELRFAIFKYFQQKYKQAFEHLDSGMGYVEQQLKLIDNARFFFHRIINRQYLLTQVKQNNNFEAVFILSLILQGQNQQIQALKQIQAFLNQKDQLFQKFQIYKRLLELYEAMRKNSLSTISISKKSLETYRQELCFLQSKNPQFQENYQFKYRFIMKIITFMKTEDNRNKQKLLKKMLDLLLLAYYKLKKCSKLAPTRQIKMKLQYTAKLIKSSKDSELMESTLNYDFVKQEYDKFKIFYKLTSRDQLLKWKFFTALINYESSSPLKNTQDKQSYKPQSILKNMAPTTMSKSQNVRDPSKSVMNSPNILNSQILRDPSFSVVNTMKNSMKQTAQFVVKHTESQVYMADSQFEGSDMIKIHASSSGNEQRYFYIIPDKINDKPRLYYSNSQKTKSGSDSYYSLKGLKKLQFGKESSAFKRKDTQKFISEQCFTMVFKDEKDRSFYVPDQDSFHRWIVLLQTKVLYSGLNQQNMANTVGFSKKNTKMNSSQSPTMKKSRKHVDI